MVQRRQNPWGYGDQLCFAAKLTIWKYTMSTALAYPGSVAQLPLPIAFHVGVLPLAKNVS